MGREPTEEEISTDTGFSVEKIREILEIAQEPISLDIPVGGKEYHLRDLWEENKVVSPPEIVSKMNLREQLGHILSTLTGLEAMVINMRFGLRDGNEHTFEEVAQEFQVTPERIKQIEAKALRKLKKKSKKLDGFFEEYHKIDVYEKSLREAVAAMSFSKGKEWLEKIKKENIKIGKLLSKEFGLIYNHDIDNKKQLEYGQKKNEIEWRHKMWLLMERSSRFELKIKGSEKRSTIDSKQQKEFPKHLKQEDKKYPTMKESSWVRGNKLEKAMLDLLREFFRISEESENNILMKLRRQPGGPQYGRDIEFDCLLKGKIEVKSYIECKNYQKPITLNDISGKLLQSKRSDPDLHHWILISPYANVSNELNENLKHWERTEEFPFEVQIWTPDNEIEEFFGLKPELHDAFFGKNGKITNPGKWSEEKKESITKKWQKRLEPPLRLPKGWKHYLENPDQFVFKHEDIKDFSDNYKTFIKMNCRDEAGIIRPLDDVIIKWLQEPVQTKPTLMLIGDFGDGKSFFTYCFSRKLAVEFSRSKKGWIPLRLSLREFNIEIIRSARLLTPQEFLKHKLDQFGSDIIIQRGVYIVKLNTWRNTI